MRNKDTLNRCIHWICILYAMGCFNNKTTPDAAKSFAPSVEVKTRTRGEACSKEFCPDNCFEGTYIPHCGCLGSRFPRAYVACQAGSCPKDATEVYVEEVLEKPEKYMDQNIKVKGYMTVGDEYMLLWSMSEYAIADEKRRQDACVRNQIINRYPLDSYAHHIYVHGISDRIPIETRKIMWQQSVEVCGRIGVSKKAYNGVSIDFSLESVQCLKDPTEP